MKQHQLGGQIGTDPNFAHATHTGHSKKDAKHSDPQPTTKLTAEEQEIYDGKKGDVLQKAIKTVVAYGQLFGAEELVDLGGAPHMAVSWGSDGVEPLLKIYKQLIDAGRSKSVPGRLRFGIRRIRAWRRGWTSIPASSRRCPEPRVAA